MHGPITAEICGIAPGGDAVLEENLADGRGDAQPLLDARPHRVVEPDARHPQGAGRADAVGDLRGMGAAHRPRQHRAVLGEQVHRPPVDAGEAAHHPIRGPAPLRHAEIRALGLGQHELFGEAARVHEPVDAFPGGELALAVLLVDGPGVAGEDAGLELGEFLFRGLCRRGRFGAGQARLERGTIVCAAAISAHSASRF